METRVTPVGRFPAIHFQPGCSLLLWMEIHKPQQFLETVLDAPFVDFTCSFPLLVLF